MAVGLGVLVAVAVGLGVEEGRGVTDGVGNGVASWKLGGVFVGDTGDAVGVAAIIGAGIGVGVEIGVADGLRLNNARIWMSLSTATVVCWATP